MSEYMTSGAEFPFSGSISPEESIELGIYVDDLAEARQRALDITPIFRDRVGMPDIVAMPDLVAEYTKAIYKIDRYDSSVITREQLANLVFLNRQSTEMLVPEFIDPETEYGSMLINTQWVADIEDIGQDLDYLEGVREVVQEVSPSKAAHINMMRFAARVWLNRFAAEEKNAAQFGASVIFGNLFEQSYSDITASPNHVLNPEEAYISKQESIENISNYCFAGVPMTRTEAYKYVVMSRDIL
jgi:hypothetical protein